jgi:hypothetical protein
MNGWGELDSAGSRQGSMASFGEHANEPLDSIKKGYFWTS